MNSSELISLLKKYPPDIEVLSYSSNTELYNELRGVIGIAVFDSDGNYICDESRLPHCRLINDKVVPAEIEFGVYGIKGITAGELGSELAGLPRDIDLVWRQPYCFDGKSYVKLNKLRKVRCAVSVKGFRDMMDYAEYESKVLYICKDGGKDYIIIYYEPDEKKFFNLKDKIKLKITNLIHAITG